MAKRTVLIVPATVPAAQVTRVLPPAQPAAPVAAAIAAVAVAVPSPTVRPVVPDQLTAEQVAQLREENRLLREELTRARQRS